GPGHPGEWRSVHRDRRDAGRIPPSVAGDRSLDQPAAESAHAIRTVVLSRRGAPETWRDATAGANRDERHRAPDDGAEPVLQAPVAARGRPARCAPGSHTEACDPGAGGRSGDGAAD